MKFSKKSEYAIKALIEMAQKSRRGTPWLQISHIAKATGIPEKFLEQILLNLKNERILKSRRGIGGGYCLNLPEGQISLDRIISILEGPPLHMTQKTGTVCNATQLIADIINNAESASQAHLKLQTLASLVDEIETIIGHQNLSSQYEI